MDSSKRFADLITPFYELDVLLWNFVSTWEIGEFELKEIQSQEMTFQKEQEVKEEFSSAYQDFLYDISVSEADFAKNFGRIFYNYKDTKEILPPYLGVKTFVHYLDVLKRISGDAKWDEFKKNACRDFVNAVMDGCNSTERLQFIQDREDLKYIFKEYPYLETLFEKRVQEFYEIQRDYSEIIALIEKITKARSWNTTDQMLLDGLSVDYVCSGVENNKHFFRVIAKFYADSLFRSSFDKFHQTVKEAIERLGVDKLGELRYEFFNRY